MQYIHWFSMRARANTDMLAAAILALGLLLATLSCNIAVAGDSVNAMPAPESPVSPVAGNSLPHHDYVLWYRNYDNPAIHALVALALEKTPEYGEFNIIRSRELSQGRVLRELERGDHRLVDIANVATTAEREHSLTPIPVPVDGGLLGFRVCVVTPESLPAFKDVQSLDDLQKKGIRIGQGAHWPDTSILQENDVSVITHSRYEILFGMLKKNRFDCFARGVSEVLHDLKVEGDQDLIIEPRLLLAYPMPSYLFVGHDDYLTAHRLQLGMERAIRDGSFGVFLERFYGTAVAALNLDERTVIVLNNPFLSEESENVGRQTLNNLRWRLQLLNR